MQIFLNGRFLSQAQSGTQRFATELVVALDRLIASTAPTIRIKLMHDRNSTGVPTFESIGSSRVGIFSGHAWEQIDFFCRSRHGLAVNLINSAPVLSSNQIITIHDASIWDVPHLYSKNYVRFHRFIRPIIAKRSKYILTVSKYSQERLSARLNLDPRKIVIVPNGCDHILRVIPDNSIITRNNLKVKGYILAVGNASPNKNIIAAVRSFLSSKIDLQMVIVGKSDPRIFGEIKAFSSRRVLYITADDSELKALYENAAMFIFPSLYEGFGIPPLEAMALNCPVIATNHPAVAETLGDAAILVDPLDAAKMTSAIQRVALDDNLQKAMVRQGVARSSLFTWDRSAEILLNLLLSIHVERGEHNFPALI